MSFKEQLKSEILPKAVDYYNSGMDINSSIVKAAQDFKLNLDQTDRLMETMNTARVIAHYEKNAEDRTANCDIADKDIIRKMLYGDKPQEKSAGIDKAASWGDYSMYMEAEVDYRGRARMTKAASAEKPEKPKSEFTIKQAADHVMDYARKVEQERKFFEERLEMAKGYVATNLSKIAHDLSRGYEPECRYALFKVACERSCPEVVRSVDWEISKAIIKDAAPHLKELYRANVVDTAPVDSVVTLAHDTEDDIQKLAEIKSRVNRCREHENEVKAVIRKYAMTVKGAAWNGPPASGEDNGDEDKKGKGKSSDPWLGDAAKAIKASIPDAPAGTKQIYDYLTGGAITPDKIEDAVFKKKEPSTKLRDYVNNMRRSDIITELYNDDPIISEASPDAVTQAYATLVQTAPEASMNKEVVRAVLRQSLNSVAVSPFDAKQWADLDNVSLKNKSLRGLRGENSRLAKKVLKED